MKRKFLFYLILICATSFGQLQNNTWYFSPTNKGIQFDFSTNAPSVITGHAPLTNVHGCGIASNPVTGAVLFYTDAVNVYDANDLQMPNGNGLNGGTSCAEKGTIVQMPDSCFTYYIFSNSANSPSSGSISYSIVDMRLSGNGTSTSPKGDVIVSSKNTLVMDTSTECYTIVPNMVGHNYWLIAPVNGTSRIKVFTISASGISYSNSFNTGIVFNSSMAIKYSNSSHKIAYTCVVENTPALLMDFNPTLGIITNAVIIPNTPVGGCLNVYNGWHDVEFSPDGTKLYLSKYRMYSPAGAGRIYQYDLNLPSSPAIVVFNNPSSDINKTVTGMQTGPDGKIYFIYYNTTTNDDRLIGAINNPNIAGVVCNVSPAVLDLGVIQSGNSRFSKPAFFNADIFQTPMLPSCSKDGINEYLDVNTITVFPNPSSGQMTVNISDHTSSTSLQVFDMVGKMVYYSELIKMKNDLQMNALDNGIYFFKFCEKETGKSILKRVVLNK